MAMNYVGSISILDRGDAPAQAVIDRNARSFAQRVADETREELQKVMHRVDNIYGNFELSTTIFETGQAANMEYVNDLAELEGLLQDSVKKRKYQQQVTIFIVGFENICGQKLRLLQQVNDFFMENIQQMEDEELNPPTPDIDMDEVSDAVEESLQTAHDLAGKLNDINTEIKDYLISYANAKATNKGKKKLEKALQQAKEDIGVLSEKLLAAQQEIEEKEDKMQMLFKQIEMKNMESQRYRTVAEVAKKTVGDSDSLKEEIIKRDELIRDLKHQIDKLMLDVGQAHHTREQSTMRMRSDMEQKSNKLEQMEKNMEEQRMDFEGEKRQLMRLHENQMEGLRETHRKEVEEIRRQHGLEIKRLLETIQSTQQELGNVTQEAKRLADAAQEAKDTAVEAERQAKARYGSAERAKKRLAQAENERDEARRTHAKFLEEKLKKEAELLESFSPTPTKELWKAPEPVGTPSTPDLASRSVSELDKEGDEDRSRPTTKDASRGSRQENRPGQQKPAASKPGNKPGLKSQQKGKNTKQKGKEYSEIGVQDEGGDPDSATIENGGPARNGKNKTSLEPVQEADLIEFDDSFDLQDEESWASVPASHVPGRFVQYRNITKKRLSELEEQLDVTITKTSRKVQTLKAQFQEHKTKWAAEREMLITQVEQAQKLQGAAETEANAAMDQLEDFINEQEELEQEEEEKRRELDQKETTVKDAVVAAAKDKLEQTLKEQQAQQQQEKEEEEMRKRLLQQTDDAKLEREKTLTEDSQQSESEGTEGMKAISLPQSPKLEVKSQSGSPIPQMSGGRESVSPGPSSLPVTPKAEEEVTHKPRRASSHTLMVPDGRVSVQSSRSLRSPEGQAQELLSRQGSHMDSGKSLSEGRSGDSANGSSARPFETPLSPEQEQVLMSLRHMLKSEANLHEPQRVALDVVRSAIDKTYTPEEILSQTELEKMKLDKKGLTLFALAALISHESVGMTLEPSSIFRMLAGLQEKVSTDEERLITLFMPDTQQVAPEFLRKVTLSGINVSEHASLVSAASRKDSSLNSLSPSKGTQSSSVSVSPGANEHPQVMVDSPQSESRLQSALSLREGSIEGDTHEAIRLSSAQSRASLRSVHRSTLSARRTAFEGRRSKSPALSLRSQKSVLSDAELDEDADLPFPDDVKEENQKSASSRHDIGTSPPPKEHTKTSLYSSKSPDIPDIKEEDEEEAETEARNDLLLDEERVDITEWKSIPMSEHPVVQEYLKTYEHIISFKDALSKLLMDKDIMSASQVLSDMEPYPFSKEDRIIPQIEDMTRNAKTMLQETAGLLTGILHMEQDYPVSSLVGLSRDNTRTNLTMREKTPESMAHRAHVKSRTTQWSAKSSGSSTAQNLKDLQDQYAVLQHRLEDETKKHADQLNHNTVVMMEMQDTINALQRELQALKASTAEGQSESRGSTPVMFTRLDSERNAKILKRAMNEQRLDSGRYQDALEKMEEYISLPARRLAQLVKKYVHHCHMKQIEENVRNSRSLNDNVFMTLDKMEALQNVRARRWADHMDNLGSERMKLAQILMDTLDNIEQESGLFLIKPMFSYRPNISPDGYLTKLSRGFRARENKTNKTQTARETAAFPPTPSSHIKALQVSQSYGGEDPRTFSSVTQQNANGLEGKSQVLVGDYPRPVWNPSVATGRPLTSENKHLLNSHLNTPRILELDINRMLIGQNQVSTHVPPFLATDDRLVNAANTSVRSYVTVNRPVGLTSGPDRPRSHTGISEHSVPPSTPQQRAGSGSITQQRSPAFSIEDVPKSLTNTPPLPPIGTKDEAPFPPRSPPGSSLRQSPPYALSGASSPANKPGVRTASQFSRGLQATI